MLIERAALYNRLSLEPGVLSLGCFLCKIMQTYSMKFYEPMTNLMHVKLDVFYIVSLL